jgi:hypothetical protein
VFENTIYFLCGGARGIFDRNGPRRGLLPTLGSGRPVCPTLAGLLGGTASAGLIAITLLRGAPWLYRSSREAFGDTVGAVLAGGNDRRGTRVWAAHDFSWARCSGHLVQNARGPEGGIGRAAALNTLGCALAAVAIGVALLPALG